MKSFLEMLTEIMACKATTCNVDGVNQAVDLMMEYALEAGLFAQKEDFNGRHALYVSTEEGKVADYLMNTHLDVVEVPSDDLFVPVVDGDKVIGRGVHDDQGQALAALRVMADLKGRASVGTIFTTDEEHGGSTTKGMVQRGYAGRKIAMVMDGPFYSVGYAQKGIITLRLRATGKAGHSAAPWNCVNAIDLLIDGYLKIREAWPKVSMTDTWKNTMAATVVSGGTMNSTNQIPDVAEMVLNIRYIKKEDYGRILEDITRISGLEIVGKPSNCCPVFTDVNTPEIQKLLQVIAKAYPEKTISPCRMNGATDARHLIDLGIPVAIIGLPGGLAHSVGEWMTLKGEQEYEALLKDYFLMG